MTASASLSTLLPMVEKDSSESLPIRYPEFAARLQKVMTDGNVTVTEIKNRLKVTYEMARRYSLGQAMPRQEKMSLLADVVGTTPEYLAFGVQPAADDDAGVRNPRQVVAAGDTEDIPGIIRIPKVRLKISAGIAGVQVDPIYGEGSSITMPERVIRQRGYRLAALVAIDVQGHSMEPSLYDGDTVVINRDDTQPKDGEVYAVNYEGEVVVKRLIKDLGAWSLASDNPDQRRYPKKQCGDMCFVLGKIVWKQSERV